VVSVFTWFKDDVGGLCFLSFSAAWLQISQTCVVYKLSVHLPEKSPCCLISTRACSWRVLRFSFLPSRLVYTDDVYKHVLYFQVYTVSRVLHTIVYLYAVRQPARGITFIIGYSVIGLMAGAVLRAVFWTSAISWDKICYCFSAVGLLFCFVIFSCVLPEIKSTVTCCTFMSKLLLVLLFAGQGVVSSEVVLLKSHQCCSYLPYIFHDVAPWWPQ